MKWLCPHWAVFPPILSPFPHPTHPSPLPHPPLSSFLPCRIVWKAHFWLEILLPILRDVFHCALVDTAYLCVRVRACVRVCVCVCCTSVVGADRCCQHKCIQGVMPCYSPSPLPPPMCAGTVHCQKSCPTVSQSTRFCLQVLSAKENSSELL